MIKFLIFMLIACIGLPSNVLRADSICQVIDQEGTYQFGSMTGDPTDTDDSLICIRASNVVLDLSFGVYSQLNGNNVAGFNGITIDPDLTNITIQNGTFNRFTGIGIEVGDGCSDIKLENIQVLNCDETGMLYNGTSLNKIRNGTITNCFIDATLGVSGGPAYGLRLIQCENIAMTNCTFNNNDAGTSNSGFGASLEFCDNCKLTNCQAAANGGNLLGAGISLSESNWTLLQNCNVIDTIARNAAGKSVGFLVDTCSYTSINGCHSTHNTNLVGNAFGFELIDGIDNSCIVSEARNNIGSTIAAGFALNGTEGSSSIFKCKSRANDGGVAGNGYGILVDGADLCDVWYNQLVGNTGIIGIGLADTTTDSTNLYAGNVAFNNTTTGFNVPQTTGTFPAATGAVDNFDGITQISKYMNIHFTT